jgi:hypothetical protein
MAVIKRETAFKHPDCGGVIIQIIEDETESFCCADCGARSDELLELVVGLVVAQPKVEDEPLGHRFDGI